MIAEIDMVYRTIFAELVAQTINERFISDFSASGWFKKVKVKEREYWYYSRTGSDGKKTNRYVGPASDPDINRRVEEFNLLKEDRKTRRDMVNTLLGIGLPQTDRFTGDIVDTLAQAGFFRLRGVLVGTVAFQSYAGSLGIKFPRATIQTLDADFAQYHSISAAVNDSIPPILDVLKELDPTFKEIPHRSDGRFATMFENKSKFKVEFLTPNRGSDDYQDKPAQMPALGGASAQPLRFMDFLIRNPQRSVLLHRSGVGITVPAPERYAVHKLIVASRRRNDDGGTLKRSKDVRQSEILIEAMLQLRMTSELSDAFEEAWDRGPNWKEAIQKGTAYTGDNIKNYIGRIIPEALDNAQPAEQNARTLR